MISWFLVHKTSTTNNLQFLGKIALFTLADFEPFFWWGFNFHQPQPGKGNSWGDIPTCKELLRRLGNIAANSEDKIFREKMEKQMKKKGNTWEISGKHGQKIQFFFHNLAKWSNLQRNNQNFFLAAGFFLATSFGKCWRKFGNTQRLKLESRMDRLASWFFQVGKILWVFGNLQDSQRIHGTGIFTYMYHKHQPNVGK